MRISQTVEVCLVRRGIHLDLLNKSRHIYHSREKAVKPGAALPGDGEIRGESGFEHSQMPGSAVMSRNQCVRELVIGDAFCCSIQNNLVPNAIRDVAQQAGQGSMESNFDI